MLCSCLQTVDTEKSQEQLQPAGRTPGQVEGAGLTRSKDIRNYLKHKMLLINEIRAVLRGPVTSGRSRHPIKRCLRSGPRSGTFPTN